MAAQDFKRSAPFGAIAIYNVVSRLEGLAGQWATWNTRRKTIRTLSALSDHELDDIGLNRYDIPAMAAQFTAQR